MKSIWGNILLVMYSVLSRVHDIIIVFQLHFVKDDLLCGCSLFSNGDTAWILTKGGYNYEMYWVVKHIHTTDQNDKVDTELNFKKTLWSMINEVNSNK